MAIKDFTIESIFSGFGSTQYLGPKNSYNSAIGIDPDAPINTTDTKASGVVTPVRYEKFSGTEIDGYPMFILPNNKTANSIIYTTAGKIHSFDSAIAMRATDEAGTALPITLTGGAGNGAAFYNNFYYLAEATDISQYGGMDQGASIAKTENVWTGAKFSKTALTNTTYPSIRGVAIPNHPMHVHSDNALYIGDVVAGQGVIHRLRTKKVTIEGDTNDTVVPSAFNALDLPYGYYPTCIESYGTDLAIGAIQSTNATINQGNAALFFWDPTNSDSFYRQVKLPDPLVTSLKNVNGVLQIFSGNTVSGSRTSEYIGGETVSEISYIEDGAPPFAGAVDAIGGRIVMGTYTTYPANSASVVAYGSKNSSLPKGLHNVARTTSTGANQNVTALKYIQQASNIQPRLIIGWGDDSAKGIDKLSTTATFNTVWRSEVFNINEDFDMESLVIPLAGAVDATTTITVKVYLDDASTTITLPVINNTNYSGKRKVKFDGATFGNASGETNFFIEISHTGTSLRPILLPIKAQADVHEK